MASPNAPASSAELIRQHSKARVLVHGPAFVVKWDHTKTPPQPMQFSRELTDADAREMVVKKYRRH